MEFLNRICCNALVHALFLPLVDAAVLSAPLQYAVPPVTPQLVNGQYAAAPQSWLQNGQGAAFAVAATSNVASGQPLVQGFQQPSAPMALQMPAGASQEGSASPVAAQEVLLESGQATARQPPQQLQTTVPSSAPAQAPATAPAQEDCKCNDTPACKISKVKVRQDHTSNGGLSMADVTTLYGGSAINEIQRRMVTLAHVATSSFSCLDDRLTEPSLVTPGGDLGEFVLGLASYVQERSTGKESHLPQEAVDALLLKYVQGLPTSRPFVHCTDERAIAHLEAQLPVENLNLHTPAEVQQPLLLKRLMEVENHGDNHIRLMLKKPEWFQLGETLLPMVLNSFYRLLWRQHQDASFPLFQTPKMKLLVLSGDANPQAFFEVTSAELCHGQGVAPMLIPRYNGRSVLISHLDAVSLRRAELAAFFARVANATPLKVDQEKLHQRLDRHGWQALETTGSRVAAGLPFYTLSYT